MLMIFNLLFIADTLAQIRAPLLQTLQEMKIIRGMPLATRVVFGAFCKPPQNLAETTCKPDAEASQPFVKLNPNENPALTHLNCTGYGVCRYHAAVILTRTALSGTVANQLVAAMLRHIVG
jgi:hypothetical protein